jgi:hypothetical protein
VRCTVFGALLVSCALAALPSIALANGRYPAAGQLVVDPADSRHIVVRATFGLLQSFDAGATWSWLCEEAIAPFGFQDPELIMATGGRITLGLPDGIAVGDRSGCQWTRVPQLANDDVIDLVENAADPATAYAAAAVTVNGAFNALVAGTTDGTTWSATGVLLPDTYPLTIETAPSRPQRLYLGAEDGNLETGFIDVSDDGGTTWVTHAVPDGVDSVYVSAVDPQDADRVYLRSYFPQGNLYVSEDGANSWSLIDQSAVAMTAFALSPDGQQLAVGGTDGLTILARVAGDAGSSYTVTTTRPLPVTCLTWTAVGLYACGDDATIGFTIGLSSDGGATFNPLLRLAELTPASCAASTSAAACGALWCATATVIGATCDAGIDAGSLTSQDAGAKLAKTPDGCACNVKDGSGAPDVAAGLGVLAWARRRTTKRRGSREPRTAGRLPPPPAAIA